MNAILPISKRRGDWPILVFFLINLFFITYIVDLEQLVIPDANHFTYPVWPPAPMVDMVHNYGHTYDPVLIARPAWWKATIAIDVFFFGPFYVLALYSFHPWPRVDSRAESGLQRHDDEQRLDHPGRRIFRDVSRASAIGGAAAQFALAAHAALHYLPNGFQSAPVHRSS